MKHLQIFEIFKKTKYKKIHELSGVALICDNKLLLVHATKYKGQNKKWSIPKGHIEGTNSLESALKELEEETGIILDTDFDELIEFDYIKGGAHKVMDVYVYLRDKSEFEEYLNGWKINQEYLNMDEIIDSRFFDIEKNCRKRIDPAMLNLIDIIEDEILI